MHPLGELTVSTASLDEWHQVEEWAAEEGWNPGRGDTATFHPIDPAGFFVGRLEPGAAPVSAISVANYSDEYAFLGYYMVRPDHRGRGLGLATWRTAFPHAGARTVGLDGVPAQQATYQRAGFETAYQTIRYTGRPRAGEGPVRTDAGSVATGADSDRTGAGAGAARTGPDTDTARTGAGAATVPVTADHLDAIAAYDRQCFPADRRAFLGRWLTAAGRTARVHLRDGQVAGYGVLRPARDGHRVGPLFADSREAAEALFDSLTAGLGPEETVSLDVPDPQRAAHDLATAHGLAPASHTVRMYAGPAPSVGTARTYGVTSLELG
ncbi:GNAT family N-acetyltransferase [Streptomyces varsoviensis]|uniref:GNAT family N-acetyltransferase n=1 Tax=Streptomyces varsoviensis TaxID=67373 RepID=UPI0033CADE63